MREIEVHVECGIRIEILITKENIKVKWRTGRQRVSVWFFLDEQNICSISF